MATDDGLSELNRTHEEVLLALADRGERLTTAEIRDWIVARRGRDMTAGNVSRNANELVDEGWVRKDQREGQAPNPTNVYELAEPGAAEVEEIESDEPAERIVLGVSPDEFDRVREQVESMASTVDALRLQVEELSDRLDTHKGGLKKLERRTDVLHDRVGVLEADE